MLQKCNDIVPTYIGTPKKNWHKFPRGHGRKRQEEDDEHCKTQEAVFQISLQGQTHAHEPGRSPRPNRRTILRRTRWRFMPARQRKRQRQTKAQDPNPPQGGWGPGPGLLGKRDQSPKKTIHASWLQYSCTSYQKLSSQKKLYCEKKLYCKKKFSCEKKGIS